MFEKHSQIRILSEHTSLASVGVDCWLAVWLGKGGCWRRRSALALSCRWRGLSRRLIAPGWGVVTRLACDMSWTTSGSSSAGADEPLELRVEEEEVSAWADAPLGWLSARAGGWPSMSPTAVLIWEAAEASCSFITFVSGSHSEALSVGTFRDLVVWQGF